MIRSRKLSTAILLFILAVVGGTDVYFASDDAKSNTYSEIILSTAHKYPIPPFAVGVLSGHKK